jgi:WD40 repeat protein
VAAGAEGLASFFVLPSLESLYGPSATLPVPPAASPPVASVPLHRRWIADVQWAAARVGPDRLLLSASDDGTLLLSRCATDPAAAVPCMVTPQARLGTELHRAGLYAMDTCAHAIATCSKDGAVGIAALHPAGGLAATRIYTDVAGVRPPWRRPWGSPKGRRGTADCLCVCTAQGAVVKQVRWQAMAPDGGLVACGGNDRAVRVLDVRRATPTPVFMAADAHASAVNTVAFSPQRPWQLLSSGFDGVIRLWDVRGADVPTATLAGHHGRHKPSLMHPIFDATGDAVLTGGQNAPHLFAYEVATGRLSTVVTLGWTPGALLLHPTDRRRLFASCGKTGIWLLDGYGP